MSARSWRWLLWVTLPLLLASCGGKGENVESEAGAAPAPRLLLIGLDGADWKIIDRLQVDGSLPNLSRLGREGSAGVLLSEEPLLSPIVWTTMATGRGPLEHGIYGFLSRRGDATLPVASHERQVRSFWNILSDYDTGVGVVGWYASWPAETVNGFLVSDQVAGHQVKGSMAAPEAGSTFPQEVAQAVEEELAAAERRSSEIMRRLVDGDPGESDDEATLEGIVRTTELYRQLLPRLIDDYHPQVAAVFFEGTDSVGHLFAGHAPPAQAGISESEARRYGETFDHYYAYIDEVVGELTAGLDPTETTVMIVSDHGFKVGESRPLVASNLSYANRAAHWHRPEGVVLLWGRGVKTGSSLQGATIYDVLPTMLGLLGLPVAETLAGRVLTEVLEPGWPAARTIADFEAAGPRVRAEVAEAEWQAQLAKLQALGYVDESELSSSGADGQDGVAVNRYNHGRILLAAGRAEEAAAEMGALQQAFPRSVLGYLGAGMVALEENDAEAAVPALRQAVELSPEMTMTWELLAQSALLTGDLPLAGQTARKALELEPASCRGALVLGRERLLARDPARAAAVLEKAWQSCGESRDRAEAAVGQAILAEARGELETAAERYEVALELAPDEPWALERAANLELVRGQPVAAASLLERMVRATNEHPRALALYGRALAEAGRLDEAREVLETSLEKAPGQEQVRRLLESISTK